MLFCPFKVTAELFFREFPSLLEPTVGAVIVVPARVPVVRFKYEDISVDVVFVSVAMAAPPTAEQLLSNSFLLQVSRETRPSANGLRTILELKRRLPVAYEVFAAVLKAVKVWAMRREVYRNMYSYPSGVVLAVMVARVCQVMPSNLPSVVFRFFFLFYSQWLSCHDNIFPIFITTSLEPYCRIPGLPESWNPKRPACRDDLFPVINPAYPYVNDARNIGRCGLEVFYAELTRAHRLLFSSDLPLDEIWRPYQITMDYSSFILVHVACEGDDAQQVTASLAAWSSYVMSKLRLLIYALERIVDARPYPHMLHDNSIVNGVGSHCYFKGNCFAIGVRERNAERTLHKSMFFEAFEELRYAVLKGCTAANDRLGFHRDERIMREPWFSLVGAADVPPVVGK